MAYQMKGTGFPQLLPESALFADHASAKYPLGMLAMDVNGNLYRYVKANEAIAYGQAVTPVALGVWDSTIVVDGAVTAGDTKIHIDTTTSAMTANQYAGYYVSQANGDGLGRLHRIASHAAISASGEGDIILDPGQPAQEAFANNAVLYIFNPYLMELTDAAVEPIRGLGVYPISSAQFGFIQVGGYHPGAIVDTDNNQDVIVNEPLVSCSTAGEVCGVDASTPAEADFNEYTSPLMALAGSTATEAGYVPCFFRFIV